MRGTTAQFKGLSPAKVRADGRSVRVPIGRLRLKAKQAIVAAPEQSLNAAQTLELLNESPQPLLPGNVALYQAGSFLGMTDLGFVASGERFSLFLSVADQITREDALAAADSQNNLLWFINNAGKPLSKAERQQRAEQGSDASFSEFTLNI